MTNEISEGNVPQRSGRIQAGKRFFEAKRLNEGGKCFFQIGEGLLLCFSLTVGGNVGNPGRAPP
ncbi:MAG: hypothetical protein SFV54_03910 [Bryobacteraceae bacterium]|nr:hypothetical protein [Bryobacteraceae bacterium]